MVYESNTKSEFVIVDTSAFIRNANLQDIGEKFITVPEVVNEIKSKRQLRRLVVLPYDLQIKEAFPENIKYVTEFAKKTGDYPSLSSTDLKVLALTYQLEKEHVGVDHLKTVPEINKKIDYCNFSAITAEDIAGFYKPKKRQNSSKSESSEFSGASEHTDDDKLVKSMEKCHFREDEIDYLSACSEVSDEDEFADCKEFSNQELVDSCPSIHNILNDKQSNEDDRKCNDLAYDANCADENDIIDKLFIKVTDDEKLAEMKNEETEERVDEGDENDFNANEESDDDDDGGDDFGWITPNNLKKVKQEMNADDFEDKPVKVACLTMDFAMQNVLKQMGLNVLSLDGRVIKQMRTFILRCYACFKTTSVMTKVFCHHCGNKTLKKVAVSLDADGKQIIHINLRRPLTARGKRFSLPKPTGGKHSNYPILSEDQPMPDQRPSRLGRTKNNPLDPDYIAGFSPFVMRDVNSKSAMLGIPNRAKELKYWMRRNPNESFGKKKKKR